MEYTFKDIERVANYLELHRRESPTGYGWLATNGDFIPDEDDCDLFIGYCSYENRLMYKVKKSGYVITIQGYEDDSIVSVFGKGKEFIGEADSIEEALFIAVIVMLRQGEATYE